MATNFTIPGTTPTPVVAINPAVITALATSSAAEGSHAVAQYSISPALEVASDVTVRLSGNGADASDYTGFEYSLNGTTWLSVAGSGLLTLPLGSTALHLRTLINADTVTELAESVSFVVAQSASATGLKDSWWVSSQVAIDDGAGAPAPTPINPSTITAQPIASSVVEGTYAQATFNISPALETSSDVIVSLSGIGADASDYTGFEYFVSGVWTTVAAGGLLTLPTGSSVLALRTMINSDSVKELGESISFVVSQSATATGLKNSWWVSSQVGIDDGPGGAVPSAPTPATITASAANFTVAEGDLATARFHLSQALSADTTVTVGVNGMGAEYGADFEGLSVSTDGINFTPLANSSLLLASGAQDFWLQTQVKTDSLTPETGESLQFVVSQGTSPTLTNSWWVTSTAEITNVAPIAGPATPLPLQIEATPQGTPVAEGQDAIASFTLNGALASDARVKVLLTGWGAEAGTDFSNVLSYRVGNSGNWTPVTNGGTLVLAANTSSFQLKTETLSDAVSPEPNESVVFVVSQESDNLTNSWWVQQSVAITDVGTPAGPGPASVVTPATISVDSASTSTVVEGGYALARFKLDKALPDAATVNASLLGWTGTVGTDTQGLEYKIQGSSTWTTLTNGGEVSIPAGKTWFDVRTKTVNDLTTEAPETMVFAVSSTSSNLKDSWYVTSTFTINDKDVVVRQGTAAAETLTGAATKQDIFDLSLGGSVGVAGGFDTIRGFGTGDVIKLAPAVNHWNLVTVVADVNAWPASDSARDTAMLNTWQSVDGQFFDAGVGGVLKVTLGNNTYLMADTNGNGKYDSAVGSATPDLFVKVIGLANGALLTAETIVT